MLVLRRRVGESIIITCGGETIRITFDHMDTMKQVKLCFEASHFVQIDREELYLDKQHHNKDKTS